MEHPVRRTKVSSQSRASGFPQQRFVVVHPPQVAKARQLALLQPFCPTDIGFFPTAVRHERRRKPGISQTIFIRCLRGTGWCDLEGTRYSVPGNTLLVIPAGCSHAYGASEDDPWSIEWFHAIGTGVPDYLRRLGLGQGAPLLELQPEAWESSLFREALSSLEEGFTESHLLYAAQALGHLLSRLILRQKRSTADVSSGPARMEKIAAYLRDHHAQSLTIPDLASMAGCSISHFASLFLKHTGHPPMDYLIRTRIEQACRLLDFTGLSIKEIAVRVGYEDPYYFSRLFKHVTTRSPKSYRDMRKG